jgi:hypothetical protein
VEIHVYHPASPTSATVWPDSTLGILGSGRDPKFALPGDVGAADGQEQSWTTDQHDQAAPIPGYLSSDLFSRPTHVEKQVIR